MKYQLILFDLGGVVITNGTKQFITRLAERTGRSEEEVKNVVDGELGTAYRENKISREEFWAQVKTELTLAETMEELEREWIDHYELIEATKGVVLALQYQGYSLYYLSDNVRERVDALDAKFGFISWFDGGVFSHEVGARKPNPEIYKRALQVAGFRPEETVYIDDKPEALEPAIKMGMTTVLYTTPENLRQELVTYNVLTD